MPWMKDLMALIRQCWTRLDRWHTFDMWVWEGTKQKGRTFLYLVFFSSFVLTSSKLTLLSNPCQKIFICSLRIHSIQVIVGASLHWWTERKINVWMNNIRVNQSSVTKKNRENVCVCTFFFFRLSFYFYFYEVMAIMNHLVIKRECMS